eukprot:Opistho-1_new@31137
MIKAGALYFSIIIAFFIAIISAAVIMVAAYYRTAYLKEIRFSRLQNNLNSGINYALINSDGYNTNYIDLFGDGMDSLIITQKHWGLHELAIVKAFISNDTLNKAMLIGFKPDSTAIYLCDEDRPISLSGNTMITGDVKMPKSGIKKSYAEGNPYVHDQMVFEGKLLYSNRELPAIDEELIKRINENLAFNTNDLMPLREQKKHCSFIDSTKALGIGKKAILSNEDLAGNLILYADSSVVIGPNVKLDGVQIYAPFIKIENGFIGNAQFFASDSICIGNNVELQFPSVAMVVRASKINGFPQIKLGSNVKFSGVLLAYEKVVSSMPTMISIGSKSHIIGEVYGKGIVKLESDVNIDGKVSCVRFIMQTKMAIYENYLINVNINRKALNK